LIGLPGGFAHVGGCPAAMVDPDGVFRGGLQGSFHPGEAMV